MTLQDTKIRPMSGRVVVMIDQDDAMTKGGLYIPEEFRKKLDTGHIIEMAADVDIEVFEGHKLAVGDEVIYDKYAGTLIDAGGDSLNVIAATDLIAVLEDIK